MFLQQYSKIYLLQFRIFLLTLYVQKFVFCFQKIVDINAAVQALIASNAALQMEVMYYTVFTLSYRICNYA